MCNEGFCEAPTSNRCVFCPNASTLEKIVAPVATSSASQFTGQQHRGINFLSEVRLMKKFGALEPVVGALSTTIDVQEV
jgi:hypothetical protein